MSASEEEYPDFITELRKRTQAVHDKSDKLVNYKLALVLTDFRLWSEAICDFYYVYQAIENGMQVLQDHPHIESLARLLMADGIRRTVAFDEDMQHYRGEKWRSEMSPSAPCKEYCDRVLKITQEDPTLLIAYIHSMYLALLAGGKIIKKIVKKSLGTSSEQGLAIFNFDTINSTELKHEVYDAINKLDIPRDVKNAIVEEKNRCFAMNNSIVNNIKPGIRHYARLLKLGGIFGLVVVLVMYLLYTVLL